MKKKIMWSVLLTAGLIMGLQSAAAQAAPAVTIDMRMNVLAPDPAGNYLTWSAGNVSLTDSLDTVTGASKHQSTAKLDMIRYDTAAAKQPAIPVGLRGLLLYPSAPNSVPVEDNLTVAANGSQVTIRYVHRGVAYELKSDTSGRLNVLNGCSMAPNLADMAGNQFVLKQMYVKAGGDPKKMSSLDWSKIRLQPDTYGRTATRHYEGLLDVKYTGGILTVKGTLTEKK